MFETNNNNSSGSNPENLKSDSNQLQSAEEGKINLAKAQGNTANPASIPVQEKDLIDFNNSDTTDSAKVADYKNEVQSGNKNNSLPTNDSSSPKHPESFIIDTEDKTRPFVQPKSGIEAQTKSFAETRSVFEGNNKNSPPSTKHRDPILHTLDGNTQTLVESYENQLQPNNQNSPLRSKDSGQASKTKPEIKGNVKQKVQQYEQNKSSSNTGMYNRTTEGNQGLYNAATQAGQSKRKNLDDNILLDTTTKKIRTSASYNSSLQNNNVNSIVQNPNTLSNPAGSKQVQLQDNQLYNNDQLGNSATSTFKMSQDHTDNNSVYPSPISQSTESEVSSLLESSNKAEDKIALGNTNHDGILEAFQALQQLLHEILSADEKYQEWQQQNPDKTPHDFQQDSILVKSISNKTKKLLEEISLAGTANIVGSGKNTPYAQANSFANQLQDLNWHNSEESNNQTVNNIFPGMISTTQKVNMSFDVNGNTQHVSKVRRVTIPTSLGNEGEASSAALVLLDKNGNRPPESKALYFTAHYSSNEGSEPKLTDITYPKPLQFCSDAPDSPCYVLQGNEAYFLPINRQELQKLLKEVDLNNGIEREPVAQDKIITNSPLAQDKIITSAVQDTAQNSRNINSFGDAVNVMSASTSDRNQGNKVTSQEQSVPSTGSLRRISKGIKIGNIITSFQQSKVNTPRSIPGKNIKTPKKPTRTPGR